MVRQLRVVWYSIVEFEIRLGVIDLKGNAGLGGRMRHYATVDFIKHSRMFSSLHLFEHLWF